MAIIKKGTYRWNDVLTLPSFAVDTDASYAFSFLASGASNIQGLQISAEFDSIKFSYTYFSNELDTTYKWMVWCRIISIDPEISNGPTLGAYLPWYRFDNNTYYTQLFGDGMQVSIVDEDFETDDEFASWFEANSQLIEETPTVDSIKSKLQALINKANEATGRDDVNLDNAVSNLVAGYGTGGGGDIIEVTELPTENINEDALYKMGDNYYKYEKEFKDVFVVVDGVANSLVGLLMQDGATIELFYVDNYENVTEPHPFDEAAMIVPAYYDASRDDVFVYKDSVWVSYSQFEGAINGGAITNISQATIDGYYYALVDNGWKTYGSPCIIEVDELPIENVNKDALYKIEGVSVCVDANLGALIPSFRDALESEGKTLVILNVDLLPTDNIMVGNDTIVYLYYLRSNSSLYAYEDGWTNLTANADLPITPIMSTTEDKYYKWVEEFDVIYNKMSLGSVYNCYYVEEKPIDNIFISDFSNEILNIYYVANEDELFVYGDADKTGENNWITLTEYTDVPYLGVISDKSEAAEGSFNVLINNYWKEYSIPVLQEKVVNSNGEVIADDSYNGLSKVTVDVPVPEGYIKPSGNLEIIENGTFDVTNNSSVTVVIPEYDGTVVVE